MKKDDLEIALNPTQFRKVGSPDFINLRTLDETDEEVYNSIYYKEVPVITGTMDEALIVTYSPKYKSYQGKIRTRQIGRAEKLISTPSCKRKEENQKRHNISHIVTKREISTKLIFTGFVDIF